MKKVYNILAFAALCIVYAISRTVKLPAFWIDTLKFSSWYEKMNANGHRELVLKDTLLSISVIIHVGLFVSCYSITGYWIVSLIVAAVAGWLLEASAKHFIGRTAKP